MDLLIAGDTTNRDLYVIIFAVAAVVVIAFLVLYFIRKRKNKDVE